MSGRIHLNTAGAGRPAPTVLPAVAGFAAEEAEYGPYEAEERHAVELNEHVYARIGALLGAAADEIALFGSATDAWCRIVCSLRPRTGSRIWVTPYEYAGNLIALAELASRWSARIEVIPVDPAGDLDLAWMRAELDETVALVSVVHVPSGCGVVQAVEEIGALLAGSGAVYVVDACQTVGHLPVDVAAIGCDLLTAAGRKFLCGPRGSGFAFVSRRIWDQVELPFYDVHATSVEGLAGHRDLADRAVRFETAERNCGVVLGLLAAVDHVAVRPAPGPDVFAALEQMIGDLPGVTVLAPGSRHAGIVSFVHDRHRPELIRDGLAAAGINGWVGTGAHTPLYLGRAGIDRFVRTSVHYDNTVEEIDVVGRILRKIIDG